MHARVLAALGLSQEISQALVCTMFISLCLLGCTTDAGIRAKQPALGSKLSSRWQSTLHTDENLSLVSSLRDAQIQSESVLADENVLLVYLEGDGNAWQSRRSPSADPTPRDPVALRLAAGARGYGRLAYIARPCQFEALQSTGCAYPIWTERRYGPRNLSLISQAIDELKREHEKLLLIGFSGGGVIAALLAASRDDVVAFITVAANLDTDRWIEHHSVSPLQGSLNPANYAETLATIPQVHLAGTRDEVVPLLVLDSYLDRIGVAAAGKVVEAADFDHGCCWVDDWRELEARAMGLLEEQIKAQATE